MERVSFWSYICLHYIRWVRRRTGTCSCGFWFLLLPGLLIPRNFTNIQITWGNGHKPVVPSKQWEALLCSASDWELVQLAKVVESLSLEIFKKPFGCNPEQPVLGSSARVLGLDLMTFRGHLTHSVILWAWESKQCGYSRKLIFLSLLREKRLASISLLALQQCSGISWN